MKTSHSIHHHAVALLLALAVSCVTARASIPIDPPVFTTPLNITNAYQPFQPGAIKMFAGNDQEQSAASADLYLTETRTFTVSGNAVECHVLQEVNFVGGVLVENTFNYFAQADDGTVYYFGEIVNTFENGVLTGHHGSWLVGGPTLPGDPSETANASAPALFMPANPEVGDIYKPEDLFPIVDETDEILAAGKTIKVPGGRFTSVIVVRESTQLDTATEKKWYAPGVGVIRARAKGELLQLIASTLQPTN